MRVKISFTRDNTSGNSIPLHHQQIVSDSLGYIVQEINGNKKDLSFSSLKGTSKIQNGFMKFLSSKVTLVISSADADLVNKVVDRIFEKSFLPVGKMNLLPRHKDVIPDPVFETRMRYLCISPMVLFDPEKEQEKSLNQVDPTSHEFSDVLYNVVLDQMEKAGVSEEQLNAYAEFDAQPDQDYIAKVSTGNKKFARIYRDNEGRNMLGYLLPFSLHAHPDVQRFIWQSGLGVLNDQGYGMVDTVK